MLQIPAVWHLGFGFYCLVFRVWDLVFIGCVWGLGLEFMALGFGFRVLALEVSF